MLKKIIIALSFLINPLTAQQTSLMQNEIEHVVILMFENRSFDNLLAWLYEHDQPQLFIPADTTQQFMGLTQNTLDLYTNTLINSAGEVVFSSPPIKGVPSVNTTRLLNSPKFNPHEPFDHVTKQIFGFNGSTTPTMTGFLQDYASMWKENDWLSDKQTLCAVMETYTDQELPVFYALAKQYAVSDYWFSSVPTQTNPNRGFALCGTSEGTIVNDSSGRTRYTSDTIWNRLVEQSSGITWAIFWQTDMIPGVFSGPYSGTNTFTSLSKIPNYQDNILKLDTFHQLARSGQLPNVCFIDPQWTLSLDVGSKNNPAGNGPFLGLQGNDLHPPGDLRPGMNLLANIYTSLISNQEAWNKTLLIVTFDEHGGLHDHVPPPNTIAPDTNFQKGFKFDRLGVRVPALFISPRIAQSTVIRSDDPNNPFDHTSLISTILSWRNIDKSVWNMGRRAAIAPTFDQVIQLTTPREDCIVTTNSTSIPEVDSPQIVHAGEPFYLCSNSGDYIVKNKFDWIDVAFTGDAKNKVSLKFAGDSGKITHGSFVLIQIDDTNFLENTQLLGDCRYTENRHVPSQWWTIKSVDNPALGAEIHYGDRVYFENHVYLDPFLYIPARLTTKNILVGNVLTTQPISDANSNDCYWTITSGSAGDRIAAKRS